MRIDLEFDKINEAMREFTKEFGVAETKQRIEQGLKKAGDYLISQQDPYNGKHNRTGGMASYFISKSEVTFDKDGMLASIDTGYEVKRGKSPTKGFHSIFIAYGTASHGNNKGIKQDKGMFNALKGEATINKATDIIIEEFLKR